MRTIILLINFAVAFKNILISFTLSSTPFDFLNRLGKFTSAVSIYLLLSSLPTLAHPFHVFIDPGHGGVDSGAVYGEAKEAKISLDVSLKLKKLLTSENLFQVTMSRQQDVSLSLNERIQKANSSRADLLVSIHANASKDRRVKGIEFFFENHLTPDEDSLLNFSSTEETELEQSSPREKTEAFTKAKDLSNILQDLDRQQRMIRSFHLGKILSKMWTNHQIGSLRQAPFRVVSKTLMPSVLVELGFMSNPKEVELLMNSEYQEEIAKKIYAGLKKYKDLVDKAPYRILN